MCVDNHRIRLNHLDLGDTRRHKYSISDVNFALRRQPKNFVNRHLIYYLKKTTCYDDASESSDEKYNNSDNNNIFNERETI